MLPHTVLHIAHHKALLVRSMRLVATMAADIILRQTSSLLRPRETTINNQPDIHRSALLTIQRNILPYRQILTHRSRTINSPRPHNNLNSFRMILDLIIRMTM